LFNLINCLTQNDTSKKVSAPEKTDLAKNKISGGVDKADTNVQPVHSVHPSGYFISTKPEPLQKDSDASKKQASDIGSVTSVTNQSLFICSKCNAKFFSAKDLKEHYEACHKEEGKN
jgi:hypothetical protein